MHTASLIGESLEDAPLYGWNVEENIEFSWEKLKNSVQTHIKGLNSGYRTDLKQNEKIDYLNSLGSFIDKNTLELTDKNGEKSKVTARRFVIAVGGRPIIPNITGYEHAITSDDIFSLKKSPGKTLCIGGSYIGLECGGFLTGCGFDTTIMIRSIPLRGFDQESARKIVEFMGDTSKKRKTKFLYGVEPKKITKQENGKLKVEYEGFDEKKEKISGEEEFDTVFFATGRVPDTKLLNLDALGVKLDKSGKIIVNEYERTSVSNIYAIGDVISGK
jgi:thioredoxin reductase (NADPH)